MPLPADLAEEDSMSCRALCRALLPLVVAAVSLAGLVEVHTVASAADPAPVSPQAEAAADPVTPTLARCTDAEYEAFTRPNPGGGSTLFLVATCSYPFAEVVLTLEGDPEHEGAYRLLQTLPEVTFDIDTFYIASFSTGLGLQDPPSEVEVYDGTGSQTVPVEARP